MPSKGVDYYFNVTTASIQATEYDSGSSSPDFSRTFGSSPDFQTGSVQIDYDFPYLYGSFNWSTATTPVVAGNAIVNPLTGNMDGGNLQNMLYTPSVIHEGFAVSYGFYDSGPGVGDLTDHDQAYAYLTPSMHNWMGQLAQQYPQMKNAPFQQFALPGAHDAGTFDLTAVYSLLNTSVAVEAYLALIGQEILCELVAVAAAQAPTAITNLAVTQKDNVVTMLNLGCRYFDFRPGYAPSQVRLFAPGVYHEHAVIPGYPFLNFLTDILNWLAANPTEVVVVGANKQGFYEDAMVPPEDVLGGILTQAQGATGSSVVAGSAGDLGTPYGELLQANKRLIFLNQLGDWYPAVKYDSYGGAYATTVPQPIINALNSMNSAGQGGSNYTVLQLQGTATATGDEVVVSCALSQSNASSPLMSTKALFDSQTYPWLSANVTNNLSNDYLVVFLNDFVDNALAQTAMTLTARRMDLR